MKIITISREFGSGGRELGKRLAGHLSFDYYDKEILTSIAKDTGLDEKYITDILEQHGWQSFPITFRRSFTYVGALSIQSTHTELLLEQKRVIEKIAKVGHDCVIVGRNADILLQQYNPFSLFVCASMEARVRRCMERAAAEEHLTEKEIMRNIHHIDKNRAQTHSILTDSKWGDKSAYQLILNTTNWNIKDLTPAVAYFAEQWFGRKKL
jgi:cytidylate kinase